MVVTQENILQQVEKLEKALYKNPEYEAFDRFLANFTSTKPFYINAKDIPTVLAEAIGDLRHNLLSSALARSSGMVARTPAFVSYPGTGKTKSIVNVLEEMVKNGSITKFLSHDMMRYDPLSAPFGVTIVIKEKELEGGVNAEWQKAMDYFSSNVDKLSFLEDFVFSDVAATIFSDGTYVSRRPNFLNKSIASIKDNAFYQMLYDIGAALHYGHSKADIQKYVAAVTELLKTYNYAALIRVFALFLDSVSVVKVEDRSVLLSYLDLSKGKVHALSYYMTFLLSYLAVSMQQSIQKYQQEGEAAIESVLLKYEGSILLVLLFPFIAFANDMFLQFHDRIQNKAKLVSDLGRMLTAICGSEKVQLSYGSAEGLVSFSDEHFTDFSGKARENLGSDAYEIVRQYCKGFAAQSELISDEESIFVQKYMNWVDSLTISDKADGVYKLISQYANKRINPVNTAVVKIVLAQFQEDEGERLEAFSDNVETKAKTKLSDIALSIISSARTDLVKYAEVFKTVHSFSNGVASVYMDRIVNNTIASEKYFKWSYEDVYNLYFLGQKLGDSNKISDILQNREENKLVFVFPSVVQSFINEARSAYLKYKKSVSSIVNKEIQSKEIVADIKMVDNPPIYVLFLDEVFHLFSGEGAPIVASIWDGLANRMDIFPPNMLLVLAGNAPAVQFFNNLNNPGSKTKISVDSMKAFFDRLRLYFVNPDAEFVQRTSIDDQLDVFNAIVSSDAMPETVAKAKKYLIQAYTEGVKGDNPFDYYYTVVAPRANEQRIKQSAGVLRHIVNYATDYVGKDVNIIHQKVQKESEVAYLNILLSALDEFYKKVYVGHENAPEIVKRFYDSYKAFLAENADVISIVKFSASIVPTLLNAYYQVQTVMRKYAYAALDERNAHIGGNALDSLTFMIGNAINAATDTIRAERGANVSEPLYNAMFLTLASLLFVLRVYRNNEKGVVNLSRIFDSVALDLVNVEVGSYAMPLVYAVDDSLRKLLSVSTDEGVIERVYFENLDYFDLANYPVRLGVMFVSSSDDTIKILQNALSQYESAALAILTIGSIKGLAHMLEVVPSGGYIMFPVLDVEGVTVEDKIMIYKATALVFMALINKFVGEDMKLNTLADVGPNKFMAILTNVFRQSQRTVTSDIAKAYRTIDMYAANLFRMYFVDKNLKDILDEFLPMNKVENLGKSKDEVVSVLLDMYNKIVSDYRPVLFGSLYKNLISWHLKTEEDIKIEYHYKPLKKLLYYKLTKPNAGVYSTDYAALIDGSGAADLDVIIKNGALLDFVLLVPFFNQVKSTASNLALSILSNLMHMFYTKDLAAIRSELQGRNIQEHRSVLLSNIGIDYKVYEYVKTIIEKGKASGTLSIDDILPDLDPKKVGKVTSGDITFKSQTGQVSKHEGKSALFDVMKKMAGSFDAYNETYKEFKKLVVDMLSNVTVEEVDYYVLLDFILSTLCKNLNLMFIYLLVLVNKLKSYTPTTGKRGRKPKSVKESEDIMTVAISMFEYIRNMMASIIAVAYGNATYAKSQKGSADVMSMIEKHMIEFANKLGTFNGTIGMSGGNEHLFANVAADNKPGSDLIREIVSYEYSNPSDLVVKIVQALEVYKMQYFDTDEMAKELFSAEDIISIINGNPNATLFFETSLDLMLLFENAIKVLSESGTDALVRSLDSVKVTFPYLSTLAQDIISLMNTNLKHNNVNRGSKLNKKWVFIDALDAKGSFMFVPTKIYVDFEGASVGAENCIRYFGFIVPQCSVNDQNIMSQRNMNKMAYINHSKTYIIERIDLALKNSSSRFLIPYLSDSDDLKVMLQVISHLRVEGNVGAFGQILAYTLLPYTFQTEDIEEMRKTIRSIASSSNKIETFLSVISDRCKHLHLLLLLVAVKYPYTDFAKAVLSYIQTNSESGYAHVSEIEKAKKELFGAEGISENDAEAQKSEMKSFSKRKYFAAVYSGLTKAKAVPISPIEFIIKE